MYICTTCGKPISANAPICFNCGEPWGRWGGSSPSYGPAPDYIPQVPFNTGCIWPILFVLFVMFACCGGSNIIKIIFGG